MGSGKREFGNWLNHLALIGVATVVTLMMLFMLVWLDIIPYGGFSWLTEGESWFASFAITTGLVYMVLACLQFTKRYYTGCKTGGTGNTFANLFTMVGVGSLLSLAFMIGTFVAEKIGTIPVLNATMITGISSDASWLLLITAVVTTFSVCCITLWLIYHYYRSKGSDIDDALEEQAHIF